MTVRVETETRDVLLRVLRANVAQDADRHHVLRLLQRSAHRHRTVEAASVVLWLPSLDTSFCSTEKERGIVDDRRGSKSFLERRGIDERLEARTRLTPGLRDVVELVLVEVEAADERADRAVLRNDRYERAFHLRQLRDGPAVVIVSDNANDRSGPHALVRLRTRAECEGRKAQTIALKGDGVAVHQRRLHLLRARRRHYSGDDLAVVGMFEQRVVDRLFAVVRIRRQID